MEFSTIYDVCVESGRPFKLTQEMLDAIEERMKQDGRESQEDTEVDFDMALVPDKNLLHDPPRNCNRAQL